MGERIPVAVHPRASRRRVELIDGVLHVWLAAAPVDGAANAELLRMLARHLGVAPSSLRILSGRTSRHKVIEVGP